TATGGPPARATSIAAASETTALPIETANASPVVISNSEMARRACGSATALSEAVTRTWSGTYAPAASAAPAVARRNVEAKPAKRPAHEERTQSRPERELTVLGLGGDHGGGWRSRIGARAPGANALNELC